MKTELRFVDIDFTLNSGLVNIPSIYRDTTPGILLTSGTHAYYDTGSPFTNAAITGWVRFTDHNDGKFRLHLGCTSGGVGKAIDIVMSATGWKVQYVNISSWDGLPDAVNSEFDFKPRGWDFIDNTFYNFKVYLANNHLKVYFNNTLALTEIAYAPAGGFTGISGIDTNTSTYVSDMYYYEEQCLWGNVNINGIPQSVDGRAVLFSQDIVEVVEYSATNTDGDYLIFLEDDPVNLNKYFLIGFIADQTDIQPRGVSNITI